MPSIEESIEFIQKAHKGQTDKSGRDYYLHPIAVMNRLPKTVGEDVLHAALLHDVIEDTEYTRQDLANMGYNDATLDVVDLVTKNSEENGSYLEKIESIIASGNVGAIRLKYADMSENTDPDRVAKLSKNDKKRLTEKYAEPIELLRRAIQKIDDAG